MWQEWEQINFSRNKLWPPWWTGAAGQGVARWSRSKGWRKVSGGIFMSLLHRCDQEHHPLTPPRGLLKWRSLLFTACGNTWQCLFLQPFEYWRRFLEKQNQTNKKHPKTFVVVNLVRFEFWAISWGIVQPCFWVLFRGISELMTWLLWELEDSTFFFLCVRN